MRGIDRYINKKNIKLFVHWGVGLMSKMSGFAFILALIVMLPTFAAADTLNFEIREYVTLSFNATGEAYSDGESTTLPSTVAKINGEIIVSNYANRTLMSDINFGVNRSGQIVWSAMPVGVYRRDLGNGIYQIHINELANRSSITINYTINASLPESPLRVTVEYFQNATLGGTNVSQTKILTNTTTDLDIRLNFSNTKTDTNLSSIYITQSDSFDNTITWQNTYWFNDSGRAAGNLTVFPYDILHWCNGGNQLGTTPATNNISCPLYVRTQVNIDPATNTPIQVDWQNLTLWFSKPNISSGIWLTNVEVRGINSTAYVEKRREDYENFSGDLAFKSYVQGADPGVKINVTSFTIWVSGNHDPNNISLWPQDNLTDMVKVYPIANESMLGPGMWVNSTNGTGTGEPLTNTFRWKVTAWDENATYGRGIVPIYWGRANYTLARAVFQNFADNRTSMHFGSNFTVYEKIYLLRGYLVRVKKNVRSYATNEWEIFITISNIGNQYTPKIFAYDLVPQNFSVDVSRIRVFPAGNLNSSVLQPLNISGNSSISGSMYSGTAYWWELNPIPNGKNVNITYNATGFGSYYTRDLFVVGIDPVEGFGSVSITPTIEMVQGTVSAAGAEALYVVLTVIGMAGAVTRRAMV